MLVAWDEARGTLSAARRIGVARLPLLLSVGSSRPDAVGGVVPPLRKPRSGAGGIRAACVADADVTITSRRSIVVVAILFALPCEAAHRRRDRHVHLLALERRQRHRRRLQR